MVGTVIFLVKMSTTIIIIMEWNHLIYIANAVRRIGHLKIFVKMMAAVTEEELNFNMDQLLIFMQIMAAY